MRGLGFRASYMGNFPIWVPCRTILGTGLQVRVWGLGSSLGFGVDHSYCIAARGITGTPSLAFDQNPCVVGGELSDSPFETTPCCPNVQGILSEKAQACYG